MTDIHCRLDIPNVLPDLPLPSPVRHRLFLAVKEALNNVVKHASATEIRLGLDVEVDHLWIEVRDDGRGFTTAIGPRDGNGLDNLRAGLAQIGGTCEIDSAPGQGTRVRMSVATSSPN